MPDLKTVSVGCRWRPRRRPPRPPCAPPPRCRPSSRCSPTPRNTTPPAPPAARRGATRAPAASAAREGMGICHAYAPDGRCISLLKILLTNACIFDCPYCINRALEQRAARALHGGGGRGPDAGLLPPQLHRGAVPLLRHHPQPRLHDGAARATWRARCARSTASAATSTSRPSPTPSRRWSTRPAATPTGLSINIELPRERQPARRWRRRRSAGASARAMGGMRMQIEERSERRAPPRRAARRASRRPGQSTQMIVGADAADDASILGTSDGALSQATGCGASTTRAYQPDPRRRRARCRRSAPPLLREHRLYQADWLLRFYGFDAARRSWPAATGGMLDLDDRPQARLGAAASRRRSRST